MFTEADLKLSSFKFRTVRSNYLLYNKNNAHPRCIYIVYIVRGGIYVYTNRGLCFGQNTNKKRMLPYIYISPAVYCFSAQLDTD